MTNPNDLDSLRRDGLREVATIGAGHAATALSQLTDRRIMISVPQVRRVNFGVVPAMVSSDREGYFAIAAQVGAAVTQEALREIYAEIERLGAEPMPEAELELVKNMMTGEMMRILDGPFGIVDAILAVTERT